MLRPTKFSLGLKVPNWAFREISRPFDLQSSQSGLAQAGDGLRFGVLARQDRQIHVFRAAFQGLIGINHAIGFDPLARQKCSRFEALPIW